MMDQDKALIDAQVHGSVSSYIWGFVLSIVLTLAAYFIVTMNLLSGTTILLTLMGLALVQVLVQFFCFLHIGQESKPRWNMGMLLFMVMVVGILVIGSLWIMFTLNDRVMPPMDMMMNLKTQK